MNEFIIQWYSKSIFNFQHSEIKQLFRKIETKSKQLITNNLHQEFNNICLNVNLLPIYTNIYIYIFVYILYIMCVYIIYVKFHIICIMKMFSDMYAQKSFISHTRIRIIIYSCILQSLESMSYR